MKNIVDIALSYVGETETPGNSGFSNKLFQERMEAVGWKKGEAWCTYFCELVWKEAMPDKADVLDRLFSGSATQTYKNFDIAGWRIGPTPSLGALVVWRYGNGWQGHMGIVKEHHNGTFETIEGNTNDRGGREGYIVAVKQRRLVSSFRENGLNLIGFIHP